LWLLGLFSGYTLGGVIHILLVIALIVVCNVIMNGTNGKRNLRYRCWGSGVRFRGP
jgi:Family of unknown function (DUF5670)